MEDDLIDLRKVQFEDIHLSERELIEKLSISKKDNRIDYNLFSNLIQKPIGYDEYAKYEGFHLKFETLREKLGFVKGEKPGDFDILIIPFSKNEIYFNRTCAIEVKIVRPKRGNNKKAPNSYGTGQIEGLIKDGFPLVGLIHICMTEPLDDQEKATIKYDPEPFDMDNPANNDHFMINAEHIKYDHFSRYSALLQMKRLLSRDIPKYVGINTIGVNAQIDGSLLTWYNYDFNNGYCSGYFNPHKKMETINKIESFYTKHEMLFTSANK